MSYKVLISLLLVLSILGLGVGVLAEPGSFGLGCADDGIFCNNPFVSIPGEPFLTVSISLFAISVALLFVRRETFIAWAKFAVPAFLIMLAIIFYTYNNEPAVGGWVNWGSDDQLATLLLPSLFFLISLIIIIRTSLKLRKA